MDPVTIGAVTALIVALTAFLAELRNWRKSRDRKDDPTIRRPDGGSSSFT
jgi:hypothetical protein